MKKIIFEINLLPFKNFIILENKLVRNSTNCLHCWSIRKEERHNFYFEYDNCLD